MHGILKRIKSSHQNLRTDKIEGNFQKLPELNKPFIIVGKSLTLPGHRIVTTTPVKGISDNDKDDKILFDTENSIYELEVYDD